MFTLILVNAVLWLAILGLGLLAAFLYSRASEKGEARAVREGGGQGQGEAPEPVRGKLEVSPQGAVLVIGDRRIPLEGQGPQLLGQAGQYLVPGTRLEVRGVRADDAWLAAASVLVALGVQVGFGD